MNVLLLIIDSLRPDHVGAYGSPQMNTPNIDSLAAKRHALQPRVPRGDGHAPGAALDLHQPADLPVPPLEAGPRARHEPRLAPITDPPTHVHLDVQAPRLLDGAGVRQPLLGFTNSYRPFRKSFDRWRSIPGQSGFVKPPRDRPARDRLRLAPAGPPRRPLHARHARVPGQLGRGRGEEQTCAARVYKEAIDALDAARLRQPFCLTVDCFDPHEPWSPAAEVHPHVQRPGLRGPRRSA